MPDNPKSAYELIRKAKTEIGEDFERRKMKRTVKLLDALTKYFIQKWKDEIDLVQSDPIAAAVAETQGGLSVSLEHEAEEEPGYYSVFNAAARALEKLKEQGFKVELDASNERPDIYKIWKK